MSKKDSKTKVTDSEISIFVEQMRIMFGIDDGFFTVSPEEQSKIDQVFAKIFEKLGGEPKFHFSEQLPLGKSLWIFWYDQDTNGNLLANPSFIKLYNYGDFFDQANTADSIADEFVAARMRDLKGPLSI